MQKEHDRNSAIMNGVAEWCAFYRENIHRFVADYLHVELRLFQKIILLMMNLCTITVFIASRGYLRRFLWPLQSVMAENQTGQNR